MFNIKGLKYTNQQSMLWEKNKSVVSKEKGARLPKGTVRCGRTPPTAAGTRKAGSGRPRRLVPSPGSGVQSDRLVEDEKQPAEVPPWSWRWTRADPASAWGSISMKHKLGHGGGHEEELLQLFRPRAAAPGRSSRHGQLALQEHARTSLEVVHSEELCSLLQNFWMLKRKRSQFLWIKYITVLKPVQKCGNMP